MDKPLSTLWRNHISSEKADILMKVRVKLFLLETSVYKMVSSAKIKPGL